MKVKKAIILLISVSLLMLFAGCNSSATDSKREPESTRQEDNPADSNATGAPEANLEYGEITDPVDLEKLWQEYLYDTITTIGNSRGFNSPDEIEPLYVAEYCWRKYVAEHGQEGLELAEKNSFSRRLFPLDTVIEYAGRYFNLTGLDVTGIEEHYYTPEKRAFIFGYGGERDRPSHTDRNPWGIHLDKVTRNTDGTITTVLAKYDSYQTRRIQLTRTYTLKQRQNGSLYFTSGRWEYVNNHLVSLTGDYRRFDKIDGFEGNLSELSILGEDNERLIMVYTPHDKKKSAALMLLNPESMAVEKKLEIREKLTSTDARLRGEKIVVCLGDKIITVAKNLEQLAEIPLPQAIRDKMAREPRYDKYGLLDIYFGGYDVSGDLQRFVYADEQGVKLLNPADGSEKLLAPTVPVAGSDLTRNYYHSHPRFIANDQKVISTLLGYESAIGYTLCDLKEGTLRTYNIGAEGSSTGYIRYDTGLLEVNTYIREQEEQTAGYKTLFLDFESGEVKEIKLEDPGETGYIVFPEAHYVGQNYAAFLTCEFDDDYANNMSYLNRIDLETLTVEAKIVSVKAAQTYILGVLADGRILFWYSLNPSEEGIGITGSRTRFSSVVGTLKVVRDFF